MKWTKEIFPSELNKYRTRKQVMLIGIGHIFDGLIILATLGLYRGSASVSAGEAMLLNAAKMRKAERKSNETANKI